LCYRKQFSCRAVITKNTVVASGTIWAGVPAKKVKDIDQSDFAGEIERISNNYVMYLVGLKTKNSLF
jgi:carbonic anhydrase/acetyltransferase-like protein (isoleucine patch superfamily)